MPDCHNCKFNGKGNPICIRCKGGETPSQKGQRMVSLDIPHSEELIEPHIRIQAPIEESVTNLPPEAEETFRIFLFELFNLSDESLLLIKWVFGGGKLSAFATLHGISRQRVSTMVSRICKVLPRVRTLFNKKTGDNGQVLGRFHQDEFYING